MSDIHSTPLSPRAALAQPRRWTLHWRVVLLILVTAAIAGEQLVFLRDSAGSAPLHAGRPQHVTTTTRLAALVSDALGPSDRGVTRFRLTGWQADPRHHGLRILNLTWSINGNLSLGSVSSGAEADVYLVLRALYTARLPLSAVRMTGTFGTRDRHGQAVETPVMVVGMDASTAALIDWQDIDASSVWPLVHQYMLRPGFECQCEE